MTTAKLAVKFRSVTYPTYQQAKSKNKNIQSRRNQLQRMNSFDYSDDEQLLSREDFTRRRDYSAEGRVRRGFFQKTRSVSSDASTTSSLSSCRYSCRQILVDSRGTSSSSSFSDANDVSHYTWTSLSSPQRSAKGVALRLAAPCSAERLLDWRRSSPEKRSAASRSHSYDVVQRISRSPEKKSFESSTSSSSNSSTSSCSSSSGRRCRLFTSTSIPPVLTKSPTEKCLPRGMMIPETSLSSESRRGRLQFRRALSLFSLSCHSKDTSSERERSLEKSAPKKILRPPTRHVYRRGMSGLPIECSSKSMGLVY